jgi:hypothetical protein
VPYFIFAGHIIYKTKYMLSCETNRKCYLQKLVAYHRTYWFIIPKERNDFIHLRFSLVRIIFCAPCCLHFRRLLVKQKRSIMVKTPKRIAIVGAGPSGLSQLLAFKQAEQEQRVELVCFERQAEWGGLWQYTALTGTDSCDEPIHSSMYR